MGFFDIFKKTKALQFPSKYKQFISKADYNLIIDIAKQYHAENGITILKIGEGEIVTGINNEEQRRYLDNLVRMLPAQDKILWKEYIYTHFDKLKEHKSAYNYFFKDFEYASQFLRVLLKPDDSDFMGLLPEMVQRTDLPKIKTLLALEYEDQFRYLKKEEIEEWGKPLDELFEIAIANIPDNEIEIKEYTYCDKFMVYIYFSGDYSASLMLDLKSMGEYAVGTFGSLVAIPTKGTAFVHPIERGDVLELVEQLNPVVIKFYQEDPGPITPYFYWYFNEHFFALPIGEDDNGHYIQLPKDLIAMLENNP